MAKNIEININNGSNSYEVLYPKASYTNMSDTLDINNTSGKLQISRLSEKYSYIVSGIYKGYGGGGSANPTYLTFSFSPNLIIILAKKYLSTNYSNLYSSNINWILITTVLTTSYLEYFGLGDVSNTGGYDKLYAKVSSNKKTVYWYCNNENYPDKQFNDSNYSYYYIAFG